MEKKHFSLTAKCINQGYLYALTQGVLYEVYLSVELTFNVFYPLFSSHIITLQ